MVTISNPCFSAMENERAFKASANSGLFSETTPAPQQDALFISTNSKPKPSAALVVESINSRVAPLATHPVKRANFIDPTP